MSIFKKKFFDETKVDRSIHAYKMKGIDIKCPHCLNYRFSRRDVLLNTPGMTFFSLEWANKTATVLTCTRCSSLQWFLDEPEVSDRNNEYSSG